MSTKSKVSKTGLNKKQGFRFRWWMAALLVGVLVVVGIVVVNFSSAGSYPNGCWIYNNSQAKYQYENSPTSCSKAEQRGRTLKAATSRPSQQPVIQSGSYPRGCTVNGKYESDPASCQRAASRGGNVVPR